MLKKESIDSCVEPFVVVVVDVVVVVVVAIEFVDCCLLFPLFVDFFDLSLEEVVVGLESVVGI